MKARISNGETQNQKPSAENWQEIPLLTFLRPSRLPAFPLIPSPSPPLSFPSHHLRFGAASALAGSKVT